LKGAYWHDQANRQLARVVQPDDVMDPAADELELPSLRNPDNHENDIMRLDGKIFDLDVEPG